MLRLLRFCVKKVKNNQWMIKKQPNYRIRIFYPNEQQLSGHF